MKIESNPDISQLMQAHKLLPYRKVKGRVSDLMGIVG